MHRVVAERRVGDLEAREGAGRVAQGEQAVGLDETGTALAELDVGTDANQAEVLDLSHAQDSPTGMDGR